MEQFSLLFLFVAMVAIWWWTWSSGKRPPKDDHEADSTPRADPRAKRRR